MALDDFKPQVVGDVVLPVKCLYFKYINGFAVPCGKCEFCRRSKAREWTFRLDAEGQYKYVYNLLLTYEDRCLVYHKGEPCVCKEHCQLFLKRLRYYCKKHFGAKLVYYLVAEYGAKRGRPHYHMVLESDVKLHNPKSPDPYSFINTLLSVSWKYGLCDIEPIRSVGGSCHYITNYMLSYDDSKEFDEHNKPFALMSRNGIGKCWIDDHPRLVKKMVTEMDYTIPIGDGKRVAIPRYLRRKIMPEEQQIARADAFYEYSANQRYLNSFKIINEYGTEQRTSKQDYFNRLTEQRELQQQRERDAYRKGKVHQDSGHPSKLSRRASAAKKF